MSSFFCDYRYFKREARNCALCVFGHSVTALPASGANVQLGSPAVEVLRFRP